MPRTTWTSPTHSWSSSTRLRDAGDLNGSDVNGRIQALETTSRQGRRPVEDDERPSPGYLWRPGASPQDNPLHLVVAIVIALVVIGSIVLALVT